MDDNARDLPTWRNRPYTVEELHESVAALVAERRVPIIRDYKELPPKPPAGPAHERCGHESCLTIRTYEPATQRWVTVVSLWEQMLDAIENGSDKRGCRGGPLAERSPADLDIMETTQLIAATVHLELTRYGKTPREDVPSSLRLLAAEIAADQDADLDWWGYRFESWSRLAQHYLGAMLDEKTQPRRLRDTPCPHCHVDYLDGETDDGPVRLRPLLLDFVGTTVRAIECTACGTAWWRGDDLHTLSGMINADRFRSYWTVVQAEVDAWADELVRCEVEAWQIEINRCHTAASVEDATRRKTDMMVIGGV